MTGWVLFATLDCHFTLFLNIMYLLRIISWIIKHSENCKQLELQTPILNCSLQALSCVCIAIVKCITFWFELYTSIVDYHAADTIVQWPVIARSRTWLVTVSIVIGLCPELVFTQLSTKIKVKQVTVYIKTQQRLN